MSSPGAFKDSATKVWWPPAGDDVTARRIAHPDDSRALAKRIAAECVVKVLRYTLTACSIGAGVPLALARLGVGCAV